MLLIGVTAWMAVMILYWPSGPSFQDDVGYFGQVKILLQGRVLPFPSDPGVWVSATDGRLLPQYPLLHSLLLLPFVGVTPRAAFLVGTAAAIACCLIASRVLKFWGRNPVWGLLLAAHPTVIIIARTVMADMPLSAFALGAWWALRRQRRIPTIILFAAMFAIKPTGIILGFALAGGEGLRLLPAIRSRDRLVIKPLITIALAVATGFALTFMMNEIATGHLWFAYDQRFRQLGISPFSLHNVPRIGLVHLRTLLLFPPLLILGVYPFWCRREWGPLFVIFGLGALMCTYFFVDYGTNWIESMILAPRLVLPIVSFLLVGYADLLASLALRLRDGTPWAGAVLVVATTAMALGISARHHRWQAPMAEALAAATRASHDVGARELGVTTDAVKAGILFSGSVRTVDGAEGGSEVVLCSTRAGSYRQQSESRYSCALPGYHSYRDLGDYRVLIRDR
jgi:hypothetical protein